MLRLVEFDNKHLQAMELISLIEELPVDNLEAIAKIPLYELFTLFDGNVGLGVVGIIKYRHHVGEVFYMPSRAFHRNYRRVMRALHSYVDCLMGEGGFVRLSMAVTVNMPTARKWAQYLGFTLEGTMKKYGMRGEDYYLFARTN